MDGRLQVTPRDHPTHRGTVSTQNRKTLKQDRSPTVNHLITHRKEEAQHTRTVILELIRQSMLRIFATIAMQEGEDQRCDSLLPILHFDPHARGYDLPATAYLSR